MGLRVDCEPSEGRRQLVVVGRRGLGIIAGRGLRWRGGSGLGGNLDLDVRGRTTKSTVVEQGRGRERGRVQRGRRGTPEEEGDVPTPKPRISPPHMAHLVVIYMMHLQG